MVQRGRRRLCRSDSKRRRRRGSARRTKVCCVGAQQRPALLGDHLQAGDVGGGQAGVAGDHGRAVVPGDPGGGDLGLAGGRDGEQSAAFTRRTPERLTRTWLPVSTAVMTKLPRMSVVGSETAATTRPAPPPVSGVPFHGPSTITAVAAREATAAALLRRILRVRAGSQPPGRLRRPGRGFDGAEPPAAEGGRRRRRRRRHCPTGREVGSARPGWPRNPSRRRHGSRRRVVRRDRPDRGQRHPTGVGCRRSRSDGRSS